MNNNFEFEASNEFLYFPMQGGEREREGEEERMRGRGGREKGGR